MVFLPGLLASFILAGASVPPPCLVRPDHIQLLLPGHGFKGPQGEGRGGRCEDVPAKKWLRQPSGSFDLFVDADGPSGSGRYWNVTIGVAKRHQSKPIRGICLVTSTAGWRTLQQWKKGPLAWLDDLDRDGKAELIIWNSFPLREEASMAEYGLMAWVYRVDSETSLAIDWNLSRKMAGEIAETYRSSLDSTTPQPGTLRAEAAEALEQFVDGRCKPALASFSPVLHGVLQEQDKSRLTPTPDPTSKYKIYVPTNLEDAFSELKKMLQPDLLQEMKEGSEQNMIQYHMGLGLWMRNNWGLWGGSRLAKYFNGIGIFHPDDMSGVVLNSFWRHLNSQPIKLDEQVAYYQRFWKVNAEPKQKKCPLDGSLIEINTLLDESEGNQFRAIHIGRCKRRKHLWAYEYDKGWYRPDAAFRKRIEQGERADEP